ISAKNYNAKFTNFKFATVAVNPAAEKEFLEHDYRGFLLGFLVGFQSVDPMNNVRISYKNYELRTDSYVFLVLFTGSTDTWQPAINMFFNFLFLKQKKKVKKPRWILGIIILLDVCTYHGTIFIVYIH